MSGDGPTPSAADGAESAGRGTGSTPQVSPPRRHRDGLPWRILGRAGCIAALLALAAAPILWTLAAWFSLRTMDDF